MPTVRKPQANRVQRRVASCHPSPTRPVTSEATAKANGTVKPTNPRYRSGGWNATKGLSWSRTLGPVPFTGTDPLTVVKGSAGPAIRAKKNAATTSVTSVAQATKGSSAWRRKRHTIAAM